MIADIEIMNRGIACLIRELGIVETEAFISYLKNEKFDYMHTALKLSASAAEIEQRRR